MSQVNQPYHRPHGKWQCGNTLRECEGCLGPTERGKCTAIAKCTPLKHGDQWTCTLSPNDGGPCADGPGTDGSCCNGPSNCRPRRSLRQYRKMFTMATTALTIGIVILVFTSPFKEEIIVPGPLTKNHAQILAHQGSDRCATCHDVGDFSLSSLTADAISGGRQFKVSQSGLCMKCHDKTLNADMALLAHNTDPAVLAHITAETKDANGATKLVSFSRGSENENSFGDIACSTCHREHHGADFNLSQMTDRQCQTCHSSSIHSFELDHPEFASWPTKRRTRIAFDHATHMQKHFAEKEKTFDCRQCHVGDPYDNVQMLDSFEKTCAECHQERIVEPGSDGLALIALPMIDLDAIVAAGQDVGEWPVAATGDFDGRIPELLKLLLTADDGAALAMARSGNDFQFSDVDPEDASQVADACKIVWAIKRLVRDLADNPTEVVRNRISQAAGEEVTDEQIFEIASQMDPAVFQLAKQQWFPALDNELAGQPVLTPGPKSETIPRRLSLAKYILKQDDKSQDDVIEKQEGLSETLVENPLAARFNKSDQVGPKGATASKSGNQSGDSVKPAQGKILPMQDDSNRDESKSQTLAKNPLKGLTQGTFQEPVTKEPVNDITNPTVVENDPATHSIAAKSIAHKSNRFASWIRNDVAFTIAYRPLSHEDAYLKGWIDLLGGCQNEESLPESFNAAFAALTSVDSVGGCASCHTIDKKFDGTVVTNWRPVYRDVSVRSFTRFSHAPHLIQPQSGDCQSCHQVDLSRDIAASFQLRDPHQFLGNFLPISKSTCASCHNESGASSSCTQCHNYHVGSRVLKK